MGSSAETIAKGVAQKDEGPKHPVSIKSFRIGFYEVKFSEYTEFARDKNQQPADNPVLHHNDGA